MLLLLGTFYSGTALWAQDEGFLLCDVCGPLQSPHAFLMMALLTGFQALAGNQVLQLSVGSLQPPAEPASAAQPHPKGGPPRLVAFESAIVPDKYRKQGKGTGRAGFRTSRFLDTLPHRLNSYGEDV